MSMKHVLVTGPRFCGKSSIVNNFLTGRGLSPIDLYHCSVLCVVLGVRHSANETTAKLVLTGNTPVKNLHSFIQVNFHQKQGIVIFPATLTRVLLHKNPLLQVPYMDHRKAR